jgi:beta-phosphoglucomutase
MADEEGIYFDREINERLRGVSRMESLEIVLEKASKKYSQTEKAALAEKKNNLYKMLIRELTPGDIYIRHAGDNSLQNKSLIACRR